MISWGYDKESHELLIQKQYWYVDSSVLLWYIKITDEISDWLCYEKVDHFRSSINNISLH